MSEWATHDIDTRSRAIRQLIDDCKVAQ